MGKWIGMGIVGLLAMIALLGVNAYNNLVQLDQGVEAQWGQVQNTYQRRADLIPNLVATVKGAAQFEQETLTKVIEARARATSTTVQLGNADPAAFQKFEQAQGELSGALARLLVSVERYPELKATENFRTLQSQLEGTENRITVERMRFNDAARTFNTARGSFPGVIFAGFFGTRFAEKPYFHAKDEAQAVPRVDFGS